MGSDVFDGCFLLRELFYLSHTPPENWIATTMTYVPDKQSYNSPSTSMNNAVVKEMITFDNNSFDYSGNTQSLTWSNNVSGFVAELALSGMDVNSGIHEEWIPVTFSNDDRTFVCDISCRYTVNPISLIVHADNKTRVYGDSNPVLSMSYTGFVNQENESVFTETPRIATIAKKTSNVGEYPITVSGGSAKNYTFEYEPGTLTITKADLEVSVNDATRVYGTGNPSFTLNYSGLKNNETQPSWEKSPTFSTAADKISDVGNYQITVDCSAKNYNITKNNPGTLTITPASLTVKANNASRSYFDAAPEYTYVATGFLNGDTDASFTQVPQYKTDATATSNVGTYTITPYGAESKNYDIKYETGVLTITKRKLTATADAISREYGENNPTFTISYDGFVNNENESMLEVIPSASSPATPTSDVGTYTISLSGGSATNYNLSLKSGVLTVTKAPLSIAVNDATRTYGASNPSFGATYSGLKNGETIPAWAASPDFRTTATTTSAVGTYPIEMASGTPRNYEISGVTNGTLSITPASLTVKANNASRLYFDADPEYTYVATGFLNGDTNASFTQAPQYKTDATATSNVGTYTITPYGAESKNYDIKYETGVLTITKRKLTATADAISREYGENNPTFTISYDGFVNNENESMLEVIPSASSPATPTSDVGTYTISLSGGSATNYNLSLKSGVLTVTKAPLSIAVNDATRTYGASNPSFGATYSGLKNGETIPAWAASPDFRTTATTTSAVGTYPIEMASGTPRNYEISGVTNGTLSITPAELTIKAKDASRAYYEDNPTFTFVCTGFVNGDDASSALQVQPTLTTTANQESNVGSYEIIAKDASSNNYNIVYTPGVLTVNKRQLVAKVGNYERIYGEENPTFVVEYEGFAGNDSENSLSTKPIAATSATSTSNVGTYPINVSGGDAANYKFSYVSGVLTINKAEQTIEWDQDLSNIKVGSQVELTAVASSGLPVEYTMEPNNSVSLYKVGTKTYIDCIAAGQVLLRASQDGNDNYYGTPRVANAINIVGNTIVDPTLTIIQGEQGLVRTQVTKGSVYTFTIEATDGWKVHSVSFNDEDITEQLDANNRFTTPNINESTTLNVVYESIIDGVASTRVSSAKILGTSFGIKVMNARPNEILKIYTIDGRLVINQKLQSSDVDVELPNNETYIILLEDLIVKLRL